jgi:hypothetical protein
MGVASKVRLQRNVDMRENLRGGRPCETRPCGLPVAPTMAEKIVIVLFGGVKTGSRIGVCIIYVPHTLLAIVDSRV